MHVKAVNLDSSHGDIVGIAEQAGRQAGSKVVRIESAALQPGIPAGKYVSIMCQESSVDDVDQSSGLGAVVCSASCGTLLIPSKVCNLNSLS